MKTFRSLNTPRLATLLPLAVLLFSSTSHAECNKGLDPPVFHAQNKILDFTTMNDTEKAQVKGFESFQGIDLQPPGVAPTSDEADANYLDPIHPGAQPDVPQSAWKRVNCVDGIEPFSFMRPLEEQEGMRYPTLPDVEGPILSRATYVKTGHSLFPSEVEVEGVFKVVDSYANPPGTNMLPGATRNLEDSAGGEMVNTLPSSKNRPYNLHESDPSAIRINPESPIDDLRYIMETLFEVITDKPYREMLTRPDDVTVLRHINDAADATDRIKAARNLVTHELNWAVDLIEGNDKPGSHVPGDRAYRGYSLLNHSGFNRVKRVLPVFDADGQVVGGEVTVGQVWYGGNIKSDTMFFDFGWEKIGPTVTDYANCGGPGQPSQVACENAAPIPPNKPWTIHYEVNVLNRGNDDFSPMTMQFDCPSTLLIGGVKQECTGPETSLPTGPVDWVNGALYASLDQSFFPMSDGTKMSVSVKMAPPQYFNLTYTWGWRVHPPRAQASENGQKFVPPGLPTEAMYCHPMRAGIIDHERFAFLGFPGPASVDAPPDADMIHSFGLASLDPAQLETCLTGFRKVLGQDKAPLDMINARLGLLSRLFPKPEPALETEREKLDYAISRISDLAPAKRMWRAFKLMQEESQTDFAGVNVASERMQRAERWITLLLDARDAYLDWLDRTHLPSGLQPDQETDLTMLYVNNTIYGQLRKGGTVEFPEWRRRSDVAKITLLNGDYFPHGYLNVDFGGARGWENLWQSTVKNAGSGPWFSFGRFHARFNTVPGSIAVDAAISEGGDGYLQPPEIVKPGVHRLMVQFNFEPSPRLRFYQFDPLHHDSAIYSMH